MSSFNNKTHRPILISVEGCIGAGKSTIIENMQLAFKDDRAVVFIQEPVDIWETITDSDGKNIIVKFYENPAKYAFSFQVMAYSTRLSIIRNAIKNNPDCKFIICERSLDADRNIFAKMLHDDGLINHLDFQIYNKFYNEYAEDFGIDGFVYIDSDSTVCMQRIIKRARDGEGGMKLDYLTKCHKYHNDWIGQNGYETAKPVLRIDTNYDASYDKNDPDDLGHKWILQIKTFIYSLDNNNNNNNNNTCNTQL
jgi:deoxyadenosine/deoxycytidine kinase